MININLIAERRARKIREMTILRVSTLSVICLSILMVLTNIAAWIVGLTTNSELIGIKVRLREQEPRYEQWQKVQHEIAARKPVVSLLEQVQKSEGAWMTVLGDMSAITPGDVVLDGMTTMINDKNVKLHLTGRARDEKTVGAFMLSISQQTRWAGDPELKNCTAVSKTDSEGADMERSIVRFDLEVPIRGLVGGDL